MSGPDLPPILVAEDEESDVMFLRRALRKAAIPHPLVVATNGREAIRYLSGEDLFSDRAQHPLPALILVDLKMPDCDGFGLLDWRLSQPSLHHLPAVVLTSSAHLEDKLKARQLGALDYFVKPLKPEALVGVVQQLHARWLAPNSPPQKPVSQ